MLTHPPQATPAAMLRPQSHRRWQHLGALLPILLVYLLLAGYGIGRQSLWLDEVFSVRDAASPALFLEKKHGPLHFALLHVWMQIGQSEAHLRALSVLLGMVAVCLFYATCTAFFRRETSTIATLLFATSPFLIWYSQEVRYIILMVAMALLAMYTFCRLLDRDHPGWWLAYGVAAALSLFSYVTTIFLLTAQGFYLVVAPLSRRCLCKWVVCMLLVSLPYGWWALNYAWRPSMPPAAASASEATTEKPAAKQLSRVFFLKFSPAMIPYTFFAFSAGFSQGPSVRELHESRSIQSLMAHAPTLLSLGALFGGLGIAGGFALWRRQNVRALFSLWLCVPLVGVLSITLMTNLGYNVRYVAYVFPLFIMILATGIARCRPRVVRVSLVIAVLLSNGVSLNNYYFNPRYARADTRAAADYLDAVLQPGDLALVVGNAAGLSYYVQDRFSLSALNRLETIEVPLGQHLKRLTANYDRLWLIALRRWEKDPTGKVKTSLDHAFALVDQQHFAGVDLYCYDTSRQ